MAERTRVQRWRTIIVPTNQVEPPHEVVCLGCFERIFTSMRRRGWRGRPLLLERVTGGWLSWTGSHRIAAAIAAGIWEVPGVEIDKGKWRAAHGAPPRSMLSETYEDECRLGWLLATGDKQAISLMRLELLDRSGCR